jgi:hypothetical protein
VSVRIVIDLATEKDRREIYRLRHAVYTAELHQHVENDQASLSDSLDTHNTYLKASVDGQLAGFVSISPPGGRDLRITERHGGGDQRSRAGSNPWAHGFIFWS